MYWDFWSQVSLRSEYKSEFDVFAVELRIPKLLTMLLPLELGTEFSDHLESNIG